MNKGLKDSMWSALRKVSRKETPKMKIRGGSFRRVAYVSTVMLAVMMGLILVPPYNKDKQAEAETYAGTPELTVAANDIELTLDNISPEGSFNKTSITNNLAVTTTNVTGYTLKIKAVDNTTDAKKLKNGSYGFDTISSAISETTFSTDDTYNNMWGILPSKVNSAANADYQPIPSDAGLVIEATSAANTVANNYSINMGVRANYVNPVGKYTGTLVLEAVANTVTYSVTFDKNTTDTVSNVPSNMTNTNTDGGYTFTLPTTSANIPVRDGYNFLGWATSASATTADYVWNGTSYSTGTITLSGTVAASQPLYAVWKQSKTITTAIYMQDFATDGPTIIASMTPNTQYQLKDNRDQKTYYISKVQTSCRNPRYNEKVGSTCYQVWMTQNLDLDLVTTSNFYTHDNTDLGWNTSAFDATRKWTAPSATVTSVGSMSDTSVTYFGSYNPGDEYYRTSGSTSNESASTSCTQADCPHYHVGNYYSWNAAVANNNLSSTKYNVRPDSICPAGWKLPTGATSSTGYTDFNYLLVQQSVIGNSYNTNGNSISYASGGLNKIRTAPLFFVRSGNVHSGSLNNAGSYGYYWSSSVFSGSAAYYLSFFFSSVAPASSYTRYYGMSVRCVAR